MGDFVIRFFFFYNIKNLFLFTREKLFIRNSMTIAVIAGCNFVCAVFFSPGRSETIFF